MNKLVDVLKGVAGVLLLAGLVVIPMTIMLSGCQEEKEVDLSFETIERSERGEGKELYSIPEPKLVVVAAPGEISALADNVSPDALVHLQNLDFDQYFAIAVFQGWRSELPTPQSGVEVQRIGRKESTITLYAQFYEPIEGYERKPIVISPYHLVKVQRGKEVQGEVEFILNVDGTAVSRQTHRLP